VTANLALDHLIKTCLENICYQSSACLSAHPAT